MRTITLAAGAALGLAVATVHSASAAPIVLTFDQLNSTVNEQPLNYYAGGLGGAGTGPGPNYGITFSPNTITGCTHPSACANTNSAGNPSGSNIIYFVSGAADTMNVAGGFTTGFSFFYSAAFNPGVINVYDGLNATGNIIATLNLPINATGGAGACLGQYFCPYTPIGVTFAGTAMSVDFGGTADQIAFDDITLGSSTPGGVPEPASLALFGGSLLGLGLIARRRAR